MTVADDLLQPLLKSLTEWMPIPDFEAAMRRYFEGNRTTAETADYRVKRGKLKTLRDEISPVRNHIRFAKLQGEIRFALDDTVPDCWLRARPTDAPQGLEVTIALAREQYHLAKELNEKGIGRGNLGLQDTATKEAFADRLAKPRIMYTAAGRLRTVADGIKLCLTKKNKPRYAGHDLLIEAPMDSLPEERWSQIEEELRASAQAMPFREIHVIANHRPFGFRIK